MSALVARTTRDVVTVTGPEAVTYLQGQVSQDVAAMEVGDVAWTFVLQPTGKVAAWARVDRAAPETFRFDVAAGSGRHARTQDVGCRLATRTFYPAKPRPVGRDLCRRRRQAEKSRGRAGRSLWRSEA